MRINFKKTSNRVILIVLDSCGCGASLDAELYGDKGSNTLGNLSCVVGPLELPHLARLGLGRIVDIKGVQKVDNPWAAYGRMIEASSGKDTTTGHWEMCGLLTQQPFKTFPNGFPPEIISKIEQYAGRKCLGNKVASGTQIIEELGALHEKTADLILYTSADSVMQIAAHEEVIPLSELYKICEYARTLCDSLKVARVIARPFIGRQGSYVRTYHRRDFSAKPPQKTVLDRLFENHLPVVGIGKIADIFAHQGVTKDVHTEGNQDGLQKLLEEMKITSSGLLFCNLVDFDMLYGHRRDPVGYYRALQEFDHFLPRLMSQLSSQDLVILTADHGNDPTFPGSDHTREDVPLLAFGKQPARNPQLGVRHGFYDIAQTLCHALLGETSWPMGESFFANI